MYFSIFLILGLLNTRVYINIEKPIKRVIHTGITFKDNKEELRFDYRAFNNNGNFITTEESRKNFTLMFPDLENRLIKKIKYRDNINFIYKEDIYWGTTNYTLSEIIELEKQIHRNYILGIYDCRHYVNDLCKLCLLDEIPIWNLEKIIN